MRRQRSAVRRGPGLPVALVALALGVATAHAGAASRYVPVFEPAPCPASVEGTPEARCGWLVVPERRSRPGGRTVRLAVAILPAPGAGPHGDPLLYVEGGPGLAALPQARFFRDLPLVRDRDLILVDPRGTGSSRPSLACPELNDLALLAARGDDAAARSRSLAEIAACRARLRAQGVRLQAYDYKEMAADLADLRRALGIERWSVYGISNGGRLALELVRRHPEGITSLVLDAALAPQGNFFLELWPHAARAFAVFFDGCARDPACGAAFPDLEARFWALVERLRTDPVTTTAVDPSSGAEVPIVFDDILLLSSLQSGLYDTALIGAIPTIIDLLAGGVGFDLVAGLIVDRLQTADVFSLGQYLSDNCREEVAFLAPGALARQARELPRLARVIADETTRKRCRVWKVGRAPAVIDRPVQNDLPTLLLVGEYDPVHPRESSEAILGHSSRGQLVELPALGHGTVDQACPRSIMQAFLADPTAALDLSCVAGMPRSPFGGS